MKHTIAALVLTAVLAGDVVRVHLNASQVPAEHVAASQRTYDMALLLAPSPLPEAALEGRIVWVQRCAFCHDGLGTPTYQTLGPWLDADSVRTLGDAHVREKIATGSARMPGFQYTLQPEQVNQLLAFLKSVSPDQKPTANQKAKIASELPAAPAAPRRIPDVARRPSTLLGSIRTADGKPLDGASVSARAVDRTFTTSVYTDERGDFVFPPLPAGGYRVWAQAVGFATERADLTLDATHPTNRTLTLQPVSDFTRQMTGTEWFDALPDDTAENRRLKQILRVSCSDCHNLGVVLQNRFDEAGWRIIVKSMEEAAHNGWTGRADPPDAEMGFNGQIIRHHRDELARYLARMRGPGPSPMKFTPRPRPRGEAARVVVIEYDLPIGERPNELGWHNGGDWSKGPGVGMHGTVGPHDVITDAAGYAWISESRISFETHRTFTKLDVNSGETTAFKLLEPDGRYLEAEQLGRDPQGRFWFTRGSTLVRIDPATETFTSFAAPRTMGGFLNSTDSDLEGRIWSNGHYGSIRFDPATKTFRMFQQNAPGDGVTYGVAADADGNGWWSQFRNDRVTKADVKTGKAFDLPMHDPDRAARMALATPDDLAFYESIGTQFWGGSSANPVLYADAPRRMSADKAGRTVWVPLWAGQHVAEIDIRTLKVTYHALPIHGQPYNTAVDKQHNVWADVPMGDSLVRLNPTTRQWTVFRLPSIGCNSRHFSIDAARDEVWLACDQTSRVARFQFRTPQQVQTQKRGTPRP
jgi:streptogramin lyase/mono/diheme cytochrome c family protein